MVMLSSLAADDATATVPREAERLALQGRLDAAKSGAERNKLGQFSTPPTLALDVLRYAKSLLPTPCPVRFLDPAIGTGAFYAALLATFPPDQIAAAEGYEIDAHYGQPAAELWADTALKVHLTDFTTASPPADNAKATLIICNPPYVRHHHMTSAEKVRHSEATTRATGIRLSGLAGLYCHFLLQAHEWLADGGLAGWLIPSEFMDVNYGREVKRYLTDHVTLHRIHRFDPNDVQFDDALVSSAVVWFTKSPPSADHAAEFSYGGTLAQPKVTVRVDAATLRETKKWTRFPGQREVGVDIIAAHRDGRLAMIQSKYTPTATRMTLADLFAIKRGLATGANEFFILSPEQVAEHELPDDVLRPILPSPRYLTTDEVEADEDGNPLVLRPRWLVDCALSEAEVENRYPTLWRYLQIGMKQGIQNGYLCQHRSPWYSQEQRLAAPILCTYLGRQGTKGGKPFRFILNLSKATAANVYLMLYPKPALAKRLEGKPKMLRDIWLSLNDIDPETLLGEGRVYGGGLHKLEPKELANAPADGILELLAELHGTPRQRSMWTV